MGKVFDGIDARLHEFLLAQPVFFVATAPMSADGHVNLSPKGLAGTFSVLDPRRVAYLDFTGSGVETVSHLRENGRIVLMFCAFEGNPRVVRLHGRGQAVLPSEPGFADLARHFPAAVDVGVRSIIDVGVTRVSDSCGFGVPLMRYERDRDLIGQWSRKKGPDGVVDYQARRNAVSIDGLPGLV